MKKSILFIFFSLLSLSIFAQLPNVPVVTGNVYAVIPDGSGGLFIGGDFTTVAGQPRNRLARINADGTLNAWNPASFSGLQFGNVYSLAIGYAKSNPTDASTTLKLFVGGGIINSVSRNVLPIYNITPTMSNVPSNGSIWDFDYDALIKKVYVGSDNRLYVGGGFSNTTTTTSQNRNGLAIYNLNATTITNVLVNYSTNPSFTDSFGNPGTVDAIEYSNNTLYVGGFFTNVDYSTSNISRNGLAAISTLDGSITSWNPALTFDMNTISVKRIYEIRLHGAYLYVAGNFVSKVASYNVSDGSLRSWSIGSILNGASPSEVAAISFFNDDVMIGGQFQTVAGNARSNFAIVSEANAAVKATTSDVNAEIFDISDVQSGNVILAGSFTNNLLKLSNAAWSTLLPQTITFNALSAVTYGDAAFNICATASSGLPVSFTSTNTSVATVSGNLITIVGAGTTTIQATQAGNSTYSAATMVPQTLTVNKANQTISFPTFATNLVATNTVNLTDAPVVASSGLAISSYTVYSDAALTTTSSAVASVALVSGKYVLTVNGSGVAYIKATQTGNANYNSTSFAQTLNVGVAKSTQTITWSIPNSVTLAYDGTPTLLVFSGAATSGLPVTYTATWASSQNINSVFNIDNSYGLGPAVTINGTSGNYAITVTATQNGNASYYPAASVTKLIYVKYIQQISGLGDLTADYKTANVTLSGTSALNTITYTVADTSVASVTGNVLTYKNAGTTTVTASQLGDANYVNAVDIVFNVTVNQIYDKITFNSLSDVAVGDANFKLTATSDSKLPVTYVSSDPSIAKIVSGNYVQIVATGDVNITASQTVGNRNYYPANDVIQSLHVNPKPKTNQTITFNTLSAVTYGDASFDLSASSDSGLSISYSSDNTSVATVTGKTVTIVGAGTANITASQSGDATYNAATSVTQALTVNKANQTITFADLTKTYGDAAFTLSGTTTSGLTITYTSSDVNVATVSGNTVTIIGAGTATITASQSGNANYNAAVDVAKTLTVNKADQTITFATISDKVMGDAPFTLSASTTSGLTITYTSSDNNVATVSGNTVTIVGEGTVTITASQSGNANYNAAVDVTQSFKVASVVTAVVSNELPSLSAYPNPTVDVININTASAKMKQIAIFNMSGQLMDTMTTENAEVSFTVASYEKGMYIVRISDQDNSAAVKFIKK